MAEEDRKYSKQLLGKTVVTKSGKRFGEVGNITFETRTGELIHLILKTQHHIQKVSISKETHRETY